MYVVCIILGTYFFMSFSRYDALMDNIKDYRIWKTLETSIAQHPFGTFWHICKLFMRISLVGATCFYILAILNSENIGELLCIFFVIALSGVASTILIWDRIYKLFKDRNYYLDRTFTFYIDHDKFGIDERMGFDYYPEKILNLKEETEKLGRLGFNLKQRRLRWLRFWLIG